jgi:hypothetical protein
MLTEAKMKKLMVTAAALTLGTSALAWAPAEKAQGAMYDGTVTAAAWSDWSKDAWSADKTQGGLKTSAAMTKPGDVVPEIFAKWRDPTVATAGAGTEAEIVPEIFAKWEDPTVGTPASASANANAVSTVEYTGMGGPLEEPQGYPTCRPGPGDDRCIQLHERGVAAELAAWKGTEPAVAMGGPYEPVASGSKDQAASHAEHQKMNHGQSGAAATHGSGHAAVDMSKPAATAPADSGVGKPAATPAAPGAIGGPIESQRGYPPCRPGRGDDRCIQLYERGVSGRNN